MPEIMVFCAEGRTLDQKRALMKNLTDVIVKDFNVRLESVTVQIIESPRTDKAKGGIPFDEIIAQREKAAKAAAG